MWGWAIVTECRDTWKATPTMAGRLSEHRSKATAEKRGVTGPWRRPHTPPAWLPHPGPPPQPPRLRPTPRMRTPESKGGREEPWVREAAK